MNSIATASDAGQGNRPSIVTARRLARNTFASGLASAWSAIVTLAMTPFLLHHLGVDSYGLWVLALGLTFSSGYLALAFDWAMHQTGVYLASPLGAAHGWGYTGSQLEWLRQNGRYAPPGKYLVGDMAIYGTPSNTVHTTICRKAGTAATAIFSSNGNENAPQPTKLAYHPDPVVGVFRHPGLL